LPEIYLIRLAPDVVSLKAGRQKAFRDQRSGADHWSAIGRGLRHQVGLVLADIGGSCLSHRSELVSRLPFFEFV